MVALLLVTLVEELLLDDGAILVIFRWRSRKWERYAIVGPNKK